MNNRVRIDTRDNGYVNMYDVCVLAGVNPDNPEDICTKYPNNCTPLKVKESKCKKTVCTGGGCKNE